MRLLLRDLVRMTYEGLKTNSTYFAHFILFLCLFIITVSYMLVQYVGEGVHDCALKGIVRPD